MNNIITTDTQVSYHNTNTGKIYYRGYDLEELVNNCEYLEVAYLLIFGTLPTVKEFTEFKVSINSVSLLREDMRKVFEGFPGHAHPMSVLITTTSAMSGFYLDSVQSLADSKVNNVMIYRLLGKIPTIVAWSYKHFLGHPFTYPKNKFSYSQNLEYLLFSSPNENYIPKPIIHKTINKLLILCSDFINSCSTSSVRVVGSSRTNVYSAISAGMSALWGGKHMVQTSSITEVLRSLERNQTTIDKVLNKLNENHSKYDFIEKTSLNQDFEDFRRNKLRKIFENLSFHYNSIQWVEISKQLLLAIENDESLKEQGLKINIEGYFSLICNLMGLPKEMTPSIMSVGKLAGWVAHWKELIDQDNPPFIQSSSYVGKTDLNFVPIEDR